MKESVSSFIIFLLLFPGIVLGNNVKIYYIYDPLKDRYTFTNQCLDYRSCKPLYVSKGEIKHKKGFRLKPGKENGFDEIIKRAAEIHKVDFHLIKSVIMAESLFDVRAVSSVGARGLMQLMPETAKELGVKNSFDPEQNIMGGAKYLKYLLKKFKSTKHALAGYNAGPAAVIYYNGVPPFDETTNYVQKVELFYKNYTGKNLW